MTTLGSESITASDQATSQDYDVLRRLSVGRKRVFEFGSFIGGSATAMIPQIIEAGGHLWCIDHFQGNLGDEATNKIPPRAIIAGFIYRIESFRKHVTVIVGETSEALNFPAGFADMVFIDAGHSHLEVCRDIAYALHLLGGKGIICGHDYIKSLTECDPDLVARYSETRDGGHGGVGYGVIRAVHEFFDGRINHEPETAVWWVDLDKAPGFARDDHVFVGRHG